MTVWKEVGEGAFASEALRRVSGQLLPGDRKLAALLVYGALRRRSLWRFMLEKRLRRPFKDLKPVTRDALMLGLAGLMELKHFNPGPLYKGLAQVMKDQGADEEVPLFHGVLKRLEREGQEFLDRLKASTSSRDVAMYYGLPLWGLSRFMDQWGPKKGRELARLMAMTRYSAFFVPPAERERLMDAMRSAGIRCWPSDELEFSVRTCFHGFPPEVPGYREGLLRPMSESSMWVVRCAGHLARGGRVLDMCCGRGIKGSALLTLDQRVTLEGWDISEGKVKAARADLDLRGLSHRGVIRAGDALTLIPKEDPDLVLLDAPCSGSGTWGRHPEGKWRMSPEEADRLSELQRQLLDRALSLVPKGGRVVYSTCSLFREENERVVGEVLSSRRDVVEEPFPFKGVDIVKGRPFGVYVWPRLPWVDGFYCAVLYRRG
ncbi:MAG: RsmB/NOP family class I SAM-dependent RNA methyltransferase [Thermanaerothrix sp.]|nr:RsmB/NOP family class I SAM-dependent RNA methyltransferase [Thermanaerothrix sp.]